MLVSIVEIGVARRMDVELHRGVREFEFSRLRIGEGDELVWILESWRWTVRCVRRIAHPCNFVTGTFSVQPSFRRRRRVVQLILHLVEFALFLAHGDGDEEESYEVRIREWRKEVTLVA